MSPRFRHRRHLPHQDLQSGCVFLTWRLHRSHARLSPTERDVAFDVIIRTPPEWCELLTLVVMDDHIHVLVRLTGAKTSRQLAQAWKSIGSRKIALLGWKRPPIWQAEYFDRPMKDASQIEACARYIVANPRKRWPDRHEYRWVLALRRPPQARRP